MLLHAVHTKRPTIHKHTSYECMDIVRDDDDDDGKKITFLNTTQLHVYVHVHARWSVQKREKNTHHKRPCSNSKPRFVFRRIFTNESASPLQFFKRIHTPLVTRALVNWAIGSGWFVYVHGTRFRILNVIERCVVCRCKTLLANPILTTTAQISTEYMRMYMAVWCGQCPNTYEKSHSARLTQPQFNSLISHSISIC